MAGALIDVDQPTSDPGLPDGTVVRIGLPVEMRLEGLGSLSNYRFISGAGAVPLQPDSVTLVKPTLQTGTQGQVRSVSGIGSSKTFDTVVGSFNSGNIGDYLFLTGDSFSPVDAYRIESVAGAQVTLDRPLVVSDPDNGTFVPGTGFTAGTGSIAWKHTGGATFILLKVNKPTLGQVYQAVVHTLVSKAGTTYDESSDSFTAITQKPRLLSAEFSDELGNLTLTFDSPMRIDADLSALAEYDITGPTEVDLQRVHLLDPYTIVLQTSGFGAGDYTLTVNASGTPKDIAGNPIDPTFNEAIFTASIPLSARSVFTDKGPIVKPDLVLQSGTGATIQTQASTFFGNLTLNEVALPGGSFTSSHVGKYLALGNTSVNAGSYRVVSVISGTRLKVEANLRLPDASNGSLTWSLFDPRTGEIADDPADVVVRVNGSPVTADAVIGLLGQVVLPFTPGSDDEVDIDYSWIADPTVEIRRLNSREFKLNGWLNDVGRSGPSQHIYRYRNAIVAPSSFVAQDLLATIEQPLLRELHYHAYERAYSVALNDPNLLLLNTPTHRIAYPPLERTVEEESVNYAADVLPEVDPSSPWERHGLGSASAAAGVLVVEDNLGGAYPTGNPLFWAHGTDLTFSHVFALSWRMVVNTTVPHGVFTGVAAGWSDTEKVALIGCLLDGGVRKLGVLKKGFGDNPSSISAWNAVTFNWSTLHSYRVIQDRDGVVRVYVDGGVVEILEMASDALPFLEELNEPFDELQGVFFGSLSREAGNRSTWDFVRYLVSPTNPQESVPAVFVSYAADVIPEEASIPWTPVGSHGNETLSAGELILDSTSYTGATDAGLISGDFRGYTRVEPLLRASSDVVLDVDLQLRTYTHGIAPNAVMAAIDDGDRLVQLSFFPTLAQPKASYPGRSLPEDTTPAAWTALGAEAAEMIGQKLRITDDSTTDGRVYFLEDLEPPSSLDRIISSTNDYYVEFKLKVVSYTPDGTSLNFCGATVDVFDGTRALGLLLRQVSSTVRRLAFHSDGVALGGGSEFNFEWFDGEEHVIRFVKSTTGNLVTLFVDTVYVGSFPYSSFTAAAGTPTISFGSSTSSSSASLSVVDWRYVNVWRGQPSTGVRKYVGIWKGFDPNALTGYHLPVSARGHAIVTGNTLTDSSATFIVAGVAVGDDLVIDVGPNKGAYQVASRTATSITIASSFPFTSTEVDYRIAVQTDWSTQHKYRIVRDPGGSVALLLDANTTPLIRLDYGTVDLPASSVGFPSIIHRGLPSVTWGAFDSTNLSQTVWDFVHYGVTSSSPTSSRIVPHHQVLNQRNVMSSPEHLTGSVVHDHTQFSSASTGIPYPWYDYVNNPAVTAFTRLNEDTPLVPTTQTYEVRRPTPVMHFLSGFNNPEDVLNSDGFLLNDGATQVRLIVPDDVLYNSLVVVEQGTGEVDLLSPFSDEMNPTAMKLQWQKEVCATYAGDVLPEFDSGFATPWTLASDSPGSVSTTAFGGVLTYTTASGNTLYRNPTPLTDPIGLTTQIDFELKVGNDASAGLGDTGIRFGFSAFGTLTAALAFVTTSIGEREVHLLDLAANQVLGGLPFDFLDGSFHTYRLVKNVSDQTIDLLIDP